MAKPRGPWKITAENKDTGVKVLCAVAQTLERALQLQQQYARRFDNDIVRIERDRK